LSRSLVGGRQAAAALVVVWAALSTANLYSVARFSYWTVAAATLALPAVIAVVVATRRGGLGAPPRAVVSGALLAVAVAIEQMRFFSYMPVEQRELAVHVVAGTCVVVAVLWVLAQRHTDRAALGLAAACFLLTSWLVIHYDPAPRIDVWVGLDQGTSGLLEGRNPYSTTWTGSPGVKDAFTYLPMTAVLLAPFNWVLGDVRWGLTAALLLTAWLLPRLDRGGTGQPALRAASLLILLTPGQLVQSEQSWTEPLLLLLLLGVLWALRDGRPVLAVVLLAVALATKQHVALLLPILACWRPLGVRRAVLAAVGGGLLCLPWFLASPSDFWRDTVTLLVDFPPLRLSPDLYIAAYRNGWTPPFWLTGVIVLTALALTAWVVRRTQPPLWRLALCLAAALLTVNLVNKQTFYNQYWLVGSLLLVALATARPAGSAAGQAAPASGSAGEQAAGSAGEQAAGSAGEQPPQPSDDVVPVPGVPDPVAPAGAHRVRELPVEEQLADPPRDR
jgi:hypothetical protein